MAKKDKTILMTKGNAKAKPLVDAVPLWEKAGWVSAQPQNAAEDVAKIENPEGE